MTAAAYETKPDASRPVNILPSFFSFLIGAGLVFPPHSPLRPLWLLDPDEVVARTPSS